MQPYREPGEQRVDEFYGLLATYPNSECVASSLEIAVQAARLRGRHGLKTPDASQAATAVHARATALVTNNEAFRRLGGIPWIDWQQLSPYPMSTPSRNPADSASIRCKEDLFAVFHF